MDPLTIAAIASSLISAGSNFFGSKNKLKQLPTKTKGQQAFQGNILQQAMGMMGQGGGYNDAMQYYQDLINPQSGAFKNFEAPYLQQFEQETVPRLAERFAGLDPHGSGIMSSGFGQAAGGAAAGLQAKLAGLKASLQQQASGSIMNQFNNLANLGLNDQFAYGSQPGSGGVFGGAGAGSAQSLPLLLYMMSQNQGGNNSSNRPLTREEFDPWGDLSPGIPPGGIR